MDQRDAMSMPSSSPFYVPTDSSMVLQAPSRMNMLSSLVHFQSNTGGTMMGSFDHSSTMPPPAISAGPPPAMMPVRRKRGRPRKYGRDSAVSLALSGHVTQTQKRRGRPPGTGRKQQQQASLGGSFITGPGKFVPHIINVPVGEDIRRQILEFAQKRQNSIILSGNGTVSAVNIRVSSGGGSVTYEGRFDILSLSGSYTQNDGNAPQGPIGCLNVTLACPDARVMGGAADGVMIAGSPVQVIMASLLPRASKTKDNNVDESRVNCEVGNLLGPAND